MRTIWKYPLQVTDEQAVHMPEDADILCVQMQGGQLTMWAAVHPGNRLVPRRVVIFGTGHPIPDDALDGLGYVGTVQMGGGSLVWHVFADVDDQNDPDEDDYSTFGRDHHGD
jgi:hypothetical protein